MKNDRLSPQLVDNQKLVEEEQRADNEARRSGMPGAIHQSMVGWTRKRRDVSDYHLARLRDKINGNF